MCSSVPLAKNDFMNMEDNYNLFKIICQSCNGFVTCKGRSAELNYTNFLHAGFSTIGLYTEDLDP